MATLRWPRSSGASGDPVSPVDDPPDRGLVTLRDARISGWFNRDTGELFPGFPVGSDDRVADVGCGDGGNLNFCALRGAEVVGVDIDADALADAGRRVAPHGNDHVRFHTAGVEQIPLESGWATRVVCTEVLEHVDDPTAAMAELVRVAAPGALLLITVPDEVGEGILQHVADPSYFQAPNHIRVFSRSGFAELVTSAGLQIVDHTTYGFFWTVWWSLFWGAGVDLDDARHPLLDEWTRLWRDMLGRPDGAALKTRLDEIAPKTQVIVARRPDAADSGAP